MSTFAQIAQDGGLEQLASSLIDKAANHPIILGVCATVGFCLWLGMRVFEDVKKEME